MTEKVQGQSPARDADSASGDNQNRADIPSTGFIGGKARPDADAHSKKSYGKSNNEHWSIKTLALLAAVGGIFAAIFAGWQAVIADRSMRISNRAYASSTNFRFIHYGEKRDGKIQWIISPLIENTGNTGTHRMMINSSILAGGHDVPDWQTFRTKRVEYPFTLARSPT